MSNIYTEGNTGNVKITGDRKSTKISIKIGGIIIVVIAVIALIGVLPSNSIEKKIIGTWQNETNTELYITFLDDNNISLTDNTGTYDGTYIFTGDNSIKISINIFIFEYAITTDISIKNNTLTFENVNDSYGSGTWLGGENATSFKRIK